MSRKTGFKELAQSSSLYPQESLAEIKTDKNKLFIGLPREISLQESRISLTPDAVKILAAGGHHIVVESKAGACAKFSDKDYSESGAEIVSSPEEVYKADIIVKIEPPTMEEIEMMKPNQVLISAIQQGRQTAEYFEKLNKKRIIALAWEYIQDKVGGFPIIRAMSEIAGSTAMLIAAEYLSNSFMGKGVIMGGITGVPPTKVVILGAGTAAEYAARAALGLGADVKVFDNHLYKLRRLKHALGQQIYTATIDTITLSNEIEEADVLIAAMRSEKGQVKQVVSEEMVSRMKPDSLVIDLTVDQGGCVETSEMTSLENPVFKKHDVIHYCVPNVASRVSNTASIALSNIFTPTIIRSGEEGGVENMIFRHSWFLKGVYCYRGSLTNPYIAQKFNMKFKDLELFAAARF